MMKPRLPVAYPFTMKRRPHVAQPLGAKRRLPVAYLVATCATLLVGGIGAGAMARALSPYGGHVLYLRLRLTPFYGSYKDMQYWIDAASGRVRYAETVPSSPNVRILTSTNIRNLIHYSAIPTPPPQWYVIAFSRRSGGSCGVTYTTLLDTSERGLPIRCGGLLTLRSVAALHARALALWRHDRSSATATGAPGIVTVPLPAGTELVPLITEDGAIWNTGSVGGGSLTLDTHTGRPISASGYGRGGPAATLYILAARNLAPGTLPGDFFDGPFLSLADRAPYLYQWLHVTLPWHP